MFDAPTLSIMPSPRLTRVHLLRHAQTEQGTVRICRGHQDVPLSAEGQKRSHEFADWYRKRYGAPSVLYSSDLRRCRGLADLLGAATVDVRLREQHMGIWEGKPWEVLTREDPAAVTAWWDDYVDAVPTGGESWRQTCIRVGGWWEEVDALRLPQITVVAHIGTIRALLCRWMGMPPGEALRWAPAQASFTEVLLADAGAVIERLGVDTF